MGLLENKILSDIEKSRTGVYKDTPENRRLHRVGQRYGTKKVEVEKQNKKISTTYSNKFSEENDMISKEEAYYDLKIEEIQEKMSVIEDKHKKDIEELKKKYGQTSNLFRKESEKLRNNLKKELEKLGREEEKLVSKMMNARERTKKNPSENKISRPEAKYVSFSGWKRNGLSQTKEYSDGSVVTSMSVSAQPDFENMRYVYSVNVSSSNVSFDDSERFNKEANELREKTFENPDDAARAADKFAEKWNKSSKKEEVKSFSENKEEQSNKKAEIIPEDNFTRVKFDDMPDSGKVNLKKYLSDKVKRNADNIFETIKDLPISELRSREQELVKNFNDTFEVSKKSVRAFNLYLILKVKNELARRGSDDENEIVEEYDIFEKLTGIKKGKPMTFEEANQNRVNPNFNLSGEYRVNCQCCVVNYELRRRGFNVQAVGNFKNVNSNSYLLSRDQTLAYINPDTGEKPEVKIVSSFSSNSLSGVKRSYKNFIENFNKETKEAGRYEFSFVWSGYNFGHIVTAERFEDGKLRIYDPQPGQVLNIEDLFKRISKKYAIRVMRVDNLDINQEFVSKIVKQSKEV